MAAPPCLLHSLGCAKGLQRAKQLKKRCANSAPPWRAEMAVNLDAR
jgi:hypothetical protein